MSTVLCLSEQAAYKKNWYICSLFHKVYSVYYCVYIWTRVEVRGQCVLSHNVGLGAKLRLLPSISKVHHFVAQTGLERAIRLLQPSERRDYRSVACHNILPRRQPEPKT